MDLLRACQRESLLRLERDRRGGLRVFQGQALVRSSAPRVEQPTGTLPLDVEQDGSAGDDQTAFMEPLEMPRSVDIVDVDEADVIDTQPVSVVDTTAELLGRAKPKKPRTRAAASHQGAAHTPAAPRGAKKAGARKPAGGRRPRARKSAQGSED